MPAELPEDREARRREAERLLVDWCIRQAKGGAESLEDLVAAHSELSADLHDLHGRMDGLESLLGMPDPGQLLRALEAPAPGGPSAAGPMDALLKDLAGEHAPAAATWRGGRWTAAAWGPSSRRATAPCAATWP